MINLERKISLPKVKNYSLSEKEKECIILLLKHCTVSLCEIFYQYKGECKESIRVADTLYLSAIYFTGEGESKEVIRELLRHRGPIPTLSSLKERAASVAWSLNTGGRRALLTVSVTANTSLTTLASTPPAHTSKKGSIFCG